MGPAGVYVGVIIILALIYNFLNGANDSANAIATVIATRALTPIKALILASFFNLLGAFAFSEVAKTIGKGIVTTSELPIEVLFMILIGGLIGATLWTYLCTIAGIPISVTHSLVGAIMGAGLVAGGPRIIQWGILTDKVFLAIALGPFVGFVAGALIFAFINWTLYLFFKTTSTPSTERFFRRLQPISASFMSFSHGMNDTQNAMGVITVALMAGGFIATPAGEQFPVPWWVRILCGIIMALGTLLMGSKVIQTMGMRLTKLEPKHGFSAEAGAGFSLVALSLAGMPVSTTHIMGSAVIGGTFFQSLSRIRWPEVARMLTAWAITIPISAAIGGASFWLLRVWW
jgi:PiT family inorganic phosphate transporter